MVSNQDVELVCNALESKKQSLYLKGEIKWTKVTDQYLDKYICAMEEFFKWVKAGKIKVRIMFRNVNDRYAGNEVSKDDKYFKLYYQFIKNAFGFLQTTDMEPFYVRIYLDQLPAKQTDCQYFKQFLRRMPDTIAFQESALRIRQDQIAEVKSHEHVILQCTDIVLGAMQFKLNGKNLVKPEGARTRGKKTIAKEKLYKFIHDQIIEIHPNFNIGVSTGERNWGDNHHWTSPYEHWKFVPRLLE